jgi:hypothetical protein
VKRWQVQFVDWHGNVNTVALCFTKLGAQRMARRLNRHLSSGLVYVRVEHEWEWSEW